MSHQSFTLNNPCYVYFNKWFLLQPQAHQSSQWKSWCFALRLWVVKIVTCLVASRGRADRQPHTAYQTYSFLLDIGQHRTKQVLMFIHPFSRFSLSLWHMKGFILASSCIIQCFTTNDCVAMCGLKNPCSPGNPEADTGRSYSDWSRRVKCHALDIVGFCSWQFDIPGRNCCPNSQCIYIHIYQGHINIKGLGWLSISPYERLILGKHVEAVHVEQPESIGSSPSLILMFSPNPCTYNVSVMETQLPKNSSRKENMQWHLQHKIEYSNTCILH